MAVFLPFRDSRIRPVSLRTLCNFQALPEKLLGRTCKSIDISNLGLIAPKNVASFTWAFTLFLGLITQLQGHFLQTPLGDDVLFERESPWLADLSRTKVIFHEGLRRLALRPGI